LGVRWRTLIRKSIPAIATRLTVVPLGRALRGLPGVRSAGMNLEPEKTSEIRNVSGVARVLATVAILALAAVGILVILEVIPRSAFAEFASKTAMVTGICVVSVIAIGFLSRR
jgi:CBS domain containing-hemolysin-like protein